MVKSDTKKSDTNALDQLFSAEAVRQRCYQVGEFAERNQTKWFSYHPEKLGDCIHRVVGVCVENYPSLDIPLHSRWRHFVVQKKENPSVSTDLWAHHVSGFSVNREALAKSAIDLAFVSVLLDAGAGGSWIYHDSITGQRLSRSEGLAAASINFFFKHLARFDSNRGWWVDAHALETLSIHQLAEGFQSSDTNPLIGLSGRLELLKGLGRVLSKSNVLSRPGDLYDQCIALSQQEDRGKEARNQQSHTIAAASILRLILMGFGDIWPSGYDHKGVNLGDCGYYNGVEGEPGTDGIVAFHKLSQWLSYSLVEPLEWGGFKVTGLDELTGLPEYRNGGLLLDSGVLQVKERIEDKVEDKTRGSGILARPLALASEPVVEWRALTVYLLDKIAEGVRTELGKNSEELPLCSVLQGGTWATGRILAMEKRGDGSPPLKLAINGTIF
ncbi:MAG: DUF1688 family protein [Gammaproteobacteria bacterium]|nr:DUF1688 family protein [Gammaproteobacteria bacterium]